METAFVTGGTGFVGASVVRVLLEKGLRVRALARKGSNRKNLEGLGVDIVEGDLTVPASIKAACKGVRYVFHVAADYRIWVRDPQTMRDANIEGTRNVLEAAAAAGAERIVHCSSVAAIKVPRDRTPVDETSEYKDESEIVSLYKQTKWLSEKVAVSLAKAGAPVVIVNPAAPIGPYDIKPTPTGRIVVDFLSGRIPSYIDTGLNVVHVRDVAEGHWLAALKGRIGERYILGGENLTFKQMLDLLAQETGMPAPWFKAPFPLALAFAAADTAIARIRGTEPMAPLDAVKMARHFMFYDSAKAARELSLPRTPAREALRDAAEWFLRNGYVKNEAKVRRALETIAARRASATAPTAAAAA
ncbi:MAG: NAD-dependent epimerase/dehydratase family protein [Elusimicrobia bacterium]|nr:NAD-dependent epimerase/dehydratase family protein [Elusimicrobiota bacterium]